ncbi:agamous-like MADS-box protein AGL61 [Malania oleifera]|uniref:agamous-like MADS-box protein AGL61 n=1 Tax=Malania oleifera TaxID=397392 RepID=UPI0025ADEDB2|nr:agamous-like MADS-box protein AGL61 [Malania oleifera]
MATTPKKQSAGRKKIPIEKITEKSNLQVSFSKRRAGLFKKAGELCILCGAEIAVIVMSPGNKFFSFGHPSVDAVVNRYLSGGASSSEPAAAVQLPTAEYNQSYAEALRELGEDRKQAAVIEESKTAASFGNGGGGEFWWDGPIDGMELEELEQFQASMKELKKNVEARAEALVEGDIGYTFPLAYATASNHVAIQGHTGEASTSLAPHGFKFGCW